MVSEETVLAKTTSVRHNLRRVRAKLPPTAEAFAADEDHRDIVIHNLWRVLQGCIDIASHVVSDEGFGQPDSFAGVFDLLVENGVLDPELGTRMRRAVGLRNLIVHEYARLDLALLHETASHDLGDVERFLARVVDHFGLGGEGGSSL